MLALTEEASTAIQELLDRPDLPPGSGLRISQGPESDSTFVVRAAMSPRFGDQVIEDDDARLFIDRGAAAVLDDKVLDVAVEAGGQVRFVVSTRS